MQLNVSLVAFQEGIGYPWVCIGFDFLHLFRKLLTIVFHPLVAFQEGIGYPWVMYRIQFCTFITIGILLQDIAI